ncbi:protein Mis18-beta isoform X2 [Dromiciops gliroides]|uniref:protein Mis18-beta isoform X2 n=1 Tax=Dromiciops gliroides TaxID=33562 RepID=UPI001CC6DABB|nr:protein Mis18-beta isoform X2 [Dromiciops gliroides]
MRRSSRRKLDTRAGARSEEEDEEEEAAAAVTSRRSGGKTTSKPLSQIFQELEAQAVRESRLSEEPSAGEEASSASMEWDTKAAKRSCPLGPHGLRGDEAKPGPSALPERDSGPLENFVVFHCLGCFAVLGDSVHLCREETRLLSILVLSRITNNVILDKSLLVGIEGALLGSYLLKTKSIINASEMEFPAKHLNEQISKLKEKIMMMDSNLTTIIQDLKTVIHGPLDVELD